MLSHREVILVDALYNLSPSSGATAEYARGILIGMVCGLMSDGLTWDRAMVECSRLAPKRILVDSVPCSYWGAFKVTDKGADSWERSEGR